MSESTVIARRARGKCEWGQWNSYHECGKDHQVEGLIVAMTPNITFIVMDDKGIMHAVEAANIRVLPEGE